jgi:hypothetical protein
MKNLFLLVALFLPSFIFAQDRVYSIEIPYLNQVLHNDTRFMHIQITPDSIIFLPTRNHNEFIEEIIKDFVCEGVAKFKHMPDRDFAFSFTTIIRDINGVDWICNNKLLAEILLLVNKPSSSDKSRSQENNNKPLLKLPYKS